MIAILVSEVRCRHDCNIVSAMDVMIAILGLGGCHDCNIGVSCGMS